MARDKIGRNDACPCGSGKKYKKCCLRKGADNPFATSVPAAPSPDDFVAGLAAQNAEWELASKLQHSSFTVDAARAVARGEKFPGAEFHPWVVARLRDLTGVAPGGKAPDHTVSSVRGMKTEKLFGVLAEAGVVLDAEGYRAATVDHLSAWELSEEWPAGSDEQRELLGLVSCELWLRLQRDPPSIEMLDGWMHEGYAALEDNDPDHACKVWVRVWELLLERLPPEVSSLREADEVFAGINHLRNWMGDVEIQLHNASLHDPGLARRAVELYRQLGERFSEGPEARQLHLQRAEFHYMLGEFQEGEGLLLRLIGEDPEDADAYAYLSSHLETERHGDEYQDQERAVQVLERALVRPVRNAEDFDLQSRLEGARERAGY